MCKGRQTVYGCAARQAMHAPAHLVQGHELSPYDLLYRMQLVLPGI